MSQASLCNGCNVRPPPYNFINGYPTKEFSMHLNTETMVKGYHTYETVWVNVGCNCHAKGNELIPRILSATKAELIVGHVLGNGLLNVLLIMRSILC